METIALSDIKKLTVARFIDLATEDAPPNFDTIMPNDFVALVTFTDGRRECIKIDNGFDLVFNNKQ